MKIINSYSGSYIICRFPFFATKWTKLSYSYRYHRLKYIMLREWEDKPQTGRKYLQNTHLIKDYYTKYTKNPNFNNKKMNMIKRWAKNLYRQLTKDVYMHKKRCSHHTSLWNFKLKQWDSTTYLLEWQESKTLTTLNAGKDEELFIHELSFINGGNAKCYSHVGRQLWQLLRKLNIFLSYR